MDVCGCEWFRNALDTMNQNGVTVVPRVRHGGRYFSVRFRWVDPVFWESLERELPQMTPFATEAELAIAFCPGCGENLARWIETHEEEFLALVARVVD